MDGQTTTTMIILFGGIIYTTAMFVYRKLSQGQTFDLQRYALTLGYVALLAIGAYMATGIMPNFEQILLQLEEGLPDAPALMALMVSVGLGIVNFLYKKQTQPATPTTTIQPAVAAPAQPQVVAPQTFGIGKVLGIYGGSASANPPQQSYTCDVNQVPTMFFEVEVIRSGVAAMELVIDNIIQKKWMPDMQGNEPYQTAKFDPVGARLPYAFTIWSNEVTVGEHSVNILLGYYDANGQNPTWTSNNQFKITFTGTKFQG